MTAFSKVPRVLELLAFAKYRPGRKQEVSLDLWPRCERAMGFIAIIDGAVFLALAGFVIYQTGYPTSKGFIVLVTTGCLGMAVGLFMFLQAGKTTN